MADWVKTGLRGVAIMAGVSLLFAWFGVYNTGRMALLPRFGFWFSTMLVGFCAAYFVVPKVKATLEGKCSLPVLLAVIAALISIPVTLVLLVISPNRFSLLEAVVQYGYVFVVALLIAGLSEWYAIMTASTGIADEAGAGDAGNGTLALLTRLPVKYRTAALYAVSAEDHYLRVHTDLGEELILMRFADALRELDGAKGLQTHRSWWVAHAGVTQARRVDGKTVLDLKSGGMASVSRRYAGDVKAAGLS